MKIFLSINLKDFRLEHNKLRISYRIVDIKWTIYRSNMLMQLFNLNDFNLH